MEDKLLEDMITYLGNDYDPDDEKLNGILLLLIKDAIDEVCNIAYPWNYSSSTEETKMKERICNKYRSKIRKIAEYHYGKQAAEGETSHSENGTIRSYESAGTPPSYLSEITPMARLI